MKFPGIEVPKTVSIDDFDYIKLEALARKFSERTDTYVSASLGLVATWGLMIQMSDFSPEFMHGLANYPENSIETFDIPTLVEEDQERLQERTAFAEEMGLGDTASEDSVNNAFDVASDYNDYLQMASGFFGTAIRPMLGLAIDIRSIILIGQTQGLVYAFTDGRGDWRDVELTTYPD